MDKGSGQWSKLKRKKMDLWCKHTNSQTVLQTGWRNLGFPGCLELDTSSAWEDMHDWNQSPVTCTWSLSSPWLQGCPSWWEWWGSTLGGPWWCRSPSWTALWPGLCCSPSAVHDSSLGQTKYSWVWNLHFSPSPVHDSSLEQTKYSWVLKWEPTFQSFSCPWLKPETNKIQLSTEPTLQSFYCPWLKPEATKIQLSLEPTLQSFSCPWFKPEATKIQIEVIYIIYIYIYTVAYTILWYCKKIRLSNSAFSSRSAFKTHLFPTRHWLVRVWVCVYYMCVCVCVCVCARTHTCMHVPLCVPCMHVVHVSDEQVMLDSMHL